MERMETLHIESWQEPIAKNIQAHATDSLESGKILYMPSLAFSLREVEESFFTTKHLDPKRKNISYDLKTNVLGGFLGTPQEQDDMRRMMKRYAELSSRFLYNLFPHYIDTLELAKTSYRPSEIEGRKSSIRKDDTRLHIDAFPSNPTKGKRILRMFTNINPEGKSRVWRVGEPFEKVVEKYACKVPPRIPGSAELLKLLHITKDKRSSYDHYMLHMHNKMKEDNLYQETVSQQEIHFPPGSSWIVFTDQVSHAAMKGQYVLEQTCSLAAHGLKNPETCPLKVLEKRLQLVMA